MRHTPHPSRRGLTLLELLIVTLAVAALFCLILLPRLGRARVNTRQMKDAVQIRGVHQGMVLFSNSRPDRFIIPSLEDRSNTTLAADSAKDDIGAVLSMHIFFGYFSPELTVSPAEESPLITPITNYQFSSPANAADPAQALWDPAFRGSPAEHGFAHTTGGAGIKRLGALSPTDAQPQAYPAAHNSYAFMPYFGARTSQWSNTFQANQAILGNRGPAYSVTASNGKPTSTLIADNNMTPGFHADAAKGTSSLTLAIHGKRTTWEGNICYNDNSVRFETQPDPILNPFTFGDTNPPRNKNPQPDNLFVSEDDAKIVGDSYPAGSTTSHFGTVDTLNLAGVNPLRNANTFLKTWVVQSVAPPDTPSQRDRTTSITFVID
jgi:hypothetical protein